MKRFWNEARVAEGEDGFAILLDGRPMRLPGGGPIRVASRPLAEALAEEWQRAGGAKDGEMRPDDVPLTRIVGTAMERIALAREGTVDAIARYGETELLCYRAEHGRLAELQAAGWDPWLAWAARDLDAALRVTAGIMPITQPPQALSALRRAVAAKGLIELSALGVAVPALGSLVLGLAMAAGLVTPAEAHRLSTLEECFQEGRWGQDAEAAARRESAAADVALAARLLALA
ncbi:MULTISPECIES: ATP12 family chaperone protein [Roseomonadaceae]|uniref:Chaperone, ATP12 n=1 Tax=Falsiroseomonas oleicola TaxID=2801474 RepID=A0ABS6HAS6_9PROT|nr:ATP12 family chaperone protein [Roseomonas oleicola]MBU8544917.1 chaperone, ATP12 [Roseomonas oleicola]